MTPLSGARGAKISARGIYRDPVRSSKGHRQSQRSTLDFRHATGPDRIMALPFLTVLAPLQAVLCQQTPSPQDSSRLGQASRSANPPLALPDRSIVLVADTAFAAIEFLAAVRNHVCVVTRACDSMLICLLFPRSSAQRPGATLSQR